ncbi:MAG: hypothetical protein E4H28_04165, partial [Gemmatimonadales bacterium]
MKLSQDSRQYSIPFISALGVLTVALAVLSWVTHERSLSLSAAVLGFYSLHLISVRFIIEDHAEDKARMESQWTLLKLMVDPNAITAETAPRISTSSGDLMLSTNGANELGAEPQRIPTARHFALGTVALIRDLLSPAQVAKILVEQRNQPDQRFAAIAHDLGMLNDEQREELLLAQQEGLFTDEEMREARE